MVEVFGDVAVVTDLHGQVEDSKLYISNSVSFIHSILAFPVCELDGNHEFLLWHREAACLETSKICLQWRLC